MRALSPLRWTGLVTFGCLLHAEAANAGVAVTIQPGRVGLTISQPQSLVAAVTGTANTAVTWSVDGIQGGNGTVGTISAGGVYTPPGTGGTHTVTATSVASPAQSASAGVAVTALAGILTQRFDNARDGQNLQEYALTPALLATPGAFGKLFSCAVDGAVYAEPLYVANLAINGGTHNVVFVATEHDSVYAFDADANPCVQYWKTSFLKAGVTTVSPDAAQDGGPNADLPVELGITGTPVIDLAANAIYVVANTTEAGPSYPYRLHALNLATGAEQANSPVVIQPSYEGQDFVPINHLQRAGLLYLGGTNTVYVPFGSHGDACCYNGWMLAFDPTSLQQTAVYNTSPGNGYDAIWMSGTGPAADANGSIYFATANGPFDAGNMLPPVPGADAYGDTVMRLSTLGGLAVADFFTPKDQAQLESQDWDLGSGGVLVLPASVGAGTAHPHLGVVGDKESRLYLMDLDNMGRYSASSYTNLQTVQVNTQPTNISTGVFSTPTAWGTTLYVGAVDDTVKAYPFSNGLMAAAPSSQSADLYHFPGANTVLSASGATNGVLWALDTNSAGQTSDTTTNGPAVLRAYDASNLANRLWSSDALGSDAAVNAVKFVVPTVANGKVYVVGQGQMTVYGLLSSIDGGLSSSLITGAEYYPSAPGVFPTSPNDFVTQAPASGYGNSGGVTTVAFSSSLVQFATLSGGGTVANPGKYSITAAFSGSTFTLSETVAAGAPALPGFEQVFSDPSFAGLALTGISSSFANGGVSATLVGTTLTIIVGANCTVSAGCQWPAGTASAQFSFGSAASNPGPDSATDAPLPAWALAGLAALLLLIAQRRIESHRSGDVRSNYWR
jgi:hypothetical protein